MLKAPSHQKPSQLTVLCNAARPTPAPPAPPNAQGNRTPHTDALSRGAFAGLTLKHTRGHVYRALLESVCYGTASILETMATAGYRPASLTMAGGATRSELWLQIHADVSGLPITITK